jgi:hypothetical protein
MADEMSIVRCNYLIMTMRKISADLLLIDIQNLLLATSAFGTKLPIKRGVCP